jgi:Na+/melibiose symporter-like transporter
MFAGTKADPFFKTAWRVVTDRLFMIKVIFFYGYQISAVMMQTSAFYVVTFLLDEPAKTITVLLGAMLVGALVSVPLWTILSHRVNNNRKMSLAAGISMFVTYIPMIFAEGVTQWTICLLLFGISVGGQWFIDLPTMGDVLDDIAVRTGKREPGIYYGYQAFFIKLGHVTIALTISITHMLTGYIEGVTSKADLMAKSPTPELALFGIRLHSAIVPAVIVLITIFLFWKWYDLTPDRIAENKVRMKDMGLL